MVTTTEVVTGVQTVIYPADTQSSKNFDQPIQIRWPEVDGDSFHLCVGTDDGNWDLLSGHIGKRGQQLFDFSDVSSAIETIYVQLISGDDGVVGQIIQIKRKH